MAGWLKASKVDAESIALIHLPHGSIIQETESEGDFFAGIADQYEYDLSQRLRKRPSEGTKIGFLFYHSGMVLLKKNRSRWIWRAWCEEEPMTKLGQNGKIWVNHDEKTEFGFVRLKAWKILEVLSNARSGPRINRCQLPCVAIFCGGFQG